MSDEQRIYQADEALRSCLGLLNGALVAVDPVESRRLLARTAKVLRVVANFLD